ncbi:hypothetical protein N825_28565 [Skermanella stibiiresistens SB22]|uniref:Uncharacterized protein n=1 Tax=Skermanella stibiiresistens SB22 TaxID=1385369 RepID=W9H5W9_9PROT|nr:hypothetical protein [Skermanella stibiiresistens]EWY41459.1 hypothetical protein N825_28565 [Skermanella stibiiresistens SB22]
MPAVDGQIENAFDLVDDACSTGADTATLPSSRIKAQAAGQATYFTGKPCKNGHISKRYTNTGSCQLRIQARNTAFRSENPERTRELDRSRHTRQADVDRRKLPRGEEKNRSPYYRLLWLTRHRARRDGIHCDLTDADLQDIIARAKGECELTGIPFDRTLSGQGYRRPFAASIDRIDNSKGYTRPNVRLVCAAMNVALGDWGEEVFARIAKGYLARRSTE